MFNYNIDFNIQFNSLLPTFFRLSKFKAYLQALTKPIAKRQADDVKYVFGSGTLPIWSTTTVTNKGSRVRRGAAVYEQTSDDAKLSNVDPLLETKFVKVFDDFRGLKHRIRHNSQKLALEYILNEFLGTTFRQPAAGNSDVFIELRPQETKFLWIGEIPEESGYIVRDATETQVKMIVNQASEINVESVDFVVRYPSTLTAVQLKEIDGIVMKYLLYGVTYTKQVAI